MYPVYNSLFRKRIYAWMLIYYFDVFLYGWKTDLGNVSEAGWNALPFFLAEKKQNKTIK